MDYADVLERNRLDAEERADALADAVEHATESVERIMRKQVADALKLKDLTRPLLMAGAYGGATRVDIDWAFGEWWSEHYAEYLLNPVKPIWDALLDFWIEEHAEAIAQARIK